MKILFYVEPHPMRDNLVEFYWIVEELLKMLDDEYNNKKHSVSTISTKLLCSRSIHAEVLKQLKEMDTKEFILGLSKEENDFILENYYKKWDEEQLLVWRDLLKGEGAVSQYYEDILKRIYKSYQFDVIVYWGTNGAVKNFSNQYSIPAIAMELGCTRKPFFQSVYFDFKGVNGAAYVNEIDLDKVKPQYTLEEIKTFLPLKQFKEKSFDAMHDVLEHSCADAVYSDAKKVMIPLQLMDDANIILYSKYNSMLEFLEDIIPSLVERGYRCFIKPHPGNIVRAINMQDHNSCKEYTQKFENVYWLEKFDNNKNLLSFYSKMDAFVVINSSVGFEAMLLGKTIVLLGHSPYNISKQLPSLEEFLADSFDKQEYMQTITAIVNLLLFHYLHHKDKAFSFNSFIEAICFNEELFYLYEENKEKFEQMVLNTQINTKLSYLRYPLRKTKIKNKVLHKVATATHARDIRVQNLKHRLKRVPILGKFMVRVKNRLHYIGN